MDNLKLPAFEYRLRNHGQSKQIFDSIRKKFVALTPEEWVRQHLINFLVKEKKYPASLLAVEMPLLLNNLKKRADIVAYNNKGEAIVLVECKAPTVKITQSSFDQAARYCLATDIILIIVSNGITNYCAEIDRVNQTYIFRKEIPDFTEIL